MPTTFVEQHCTCRVLPDWYCMIRLLPGRQCAEIWRKRDSIGTDQGPRRDRAGLTAAGVGSGALVRVRNGIAKAKWEAPRLLKIEGLCIRSYQVHFSFDILHTHFSFDSLHTHFSFDILHTNFSFGHSTIVTFPPLSRSATRLVTSRPTLIPMTCPRPPEVLPRLAQSWPSSAT